jgi:hypothetical protein
VIAQQSVDIGDEMPGFEVMFTLEDVTGFLGAWTGRTGGGGSRFTDASVAQREGFGQRPIVPGRMGLAYIARAILEWLPEGRIDKLDIVFRSPTFQGVKHQVGGVVTGKSEDDSQVTLELDVYLEREDGERPHRGAAVVVLPKQ